VLEQDYVIFEKNEKWRLDGGAPCPNTQICEQNTKIFRSGKIVGVGAKMFTGILSQGEINRLASAIVSSDIFSKDCVPQDKARLTSYVIKLGTQTKRIDYSGCKTELEQIESQVMIK